jgi:hypothetical protein
MFIRLAVRTFFTISAFSVFVAFMGLVLKDLLAHYISAVPNLGPMLLVAGVFVCILIGLQSGRLFLIASAIPRILLLTIIFSFIASNINSYATLDRFNTSPLFISFFLALILFSANKRAILWVLIAIPAMNFILQIWETYSGQLLFPTIVTLYDFTVDSEGWKIGENEIRTKGLFQGPLHIVSICLLALIVKPYSLLLRLIMLGAAYLSGARLGIFISIVLLVIYFATSAHARRLMRFNTLLKLFVASCSVVVIIFTMAQLGLLSEERINFILLAFDFINNDSNLHRVVVWLYSLQMYLSYDVSGILFGRYDEIRFLSDQGSAESDWLRLLVDNGFLGMCVYLIAFGDLVRRAWADNNSARLVCLTALFVSMHIFPSIGWLAGATGFWIIYFFQVYNDITCRSKRSPAMLFLLKQDTPVVRCLNGEEDIQAMHRI